MSYRDELAAAQSRAAALEKQVAELERQSARPLECPACGAVARPEDLDVGRGLLSCHGCRGVFRLPDRPPPAPAPRPARPVPERFRVEASGDTARIVWRWFSPAKHLFLLVFAAAWCAFLAAWYSFASDGGWFFMIFPLVHVAVGVGLLYGALAGILNHTEILASSRFLQIQHGPLPAWPRVGRIERERLAQLFARRQEHTHKGSTTITYELHALCDDGSSKKLLTGLEDLEQALWLEQMLEERLGIADRMVPGEVSRAER